jgi:hypothetical protein
MLPDFWKNATGFGQSERTRRREKGPSLLRKLQEVHEIMKKPDPPFMEDGQRQSGE